MGQHGTVLRTSPLLNRGQWQEELQEDDDKEFLLDSILNGFQLIPASSTLAPAEMDNYGSSTKPEVRAKVERTIQEDLQERSYSVTHSQPTIAGAIGAVAKANSDERRLIHDCSMPEGLGVNSYVLSRVKLHFQTIDDAIKSC